MLISVFTFSVNTHVHADHITGTGELKRLIPTCKSVIAEVSGAVADVKIKHGDKIKFGKYEIEARSTPGHTSGKSGPETEINNAQLK